MVRRNSGATKPDPALKTTKRCKDSRERGIPEKSQINVSLLATSCFFAMHGLLNTLCAVKVHYVIVVGNTPEYVSITASKDAKG